MGSTVGTALFRWRWLLLPTDSQTVALCHPGDENVALLTHVRFSVALLGDPCPFLSGPYFVLFINTLWSSHCHPLPVLQLFLASQCCELKSVAPGASLHADSSFPQPQCTLDVSVLSTGTVLRLRTPALLLPVPLAPLPSLAGRHFLQVSSRFILSPVSHWAFP